MAEEKQTELIDETNNRDDMNALNYVLATVRGSHPVSIYAPDAITVDNDFDGYAEAK